MTITELKPFLDKTVTLCLRNGEVATVKIGFVDAEYQDIIVDVLRTTHPAQYKGTSNSAYTIPASDIASVQEIPT